MATLQSPSDQQIQARVRMENPWWQTGAVDPFYDAMKHRAFFAPFQGLVRTRTRRAVVLMGPRRVGKTVMLHQLVKGLIEAGIPAKKICLVSVDQPVYSRMRLDDLFKTCREALKEKDPSGFHVIFDEIQYLNDWERDLKVLVDSYPRTRFIASGSAAAALKTKSRESGAGRFTEFILPPLTFHEFLLLTGQHGLIVPTARKWGEKELPFHDTLDIRALNDQFAQYITYGGYPEAVFDPEVKQEPGRFIRTDIIDKVLLRDLPSIYGISDVQELNRFFSVVAFNTGQEFAYGALSRTSGVDAATIRKFLEYLEAAFLIKRLRRIDMSAKHYQREHGFKAYLTNPSLRTAMFGPMASDEPGFGALAETAVHAQDLTRQYELYYANWKIGRTQGEVDMVRLDGRLKPTRICEVKWSDRIVDHPGELKGFRGFASAHKLHWGVVTTKTILDTRSVDGLEIRFVPTALYSYHRGLRAVEAVSAAQNP